MKILAETVAHTAQRYDTVGDYQIDTDLFQGEEVWRFKITKTGDWRASAAVLLHEYVEAMLCKNAGITPDGIDAWDLQPRLRGKNREPGDIPGCPYAEQHRFAENLERLFVAQMGLTWQEYSEELERAQAGS